MGIFKASRFHQQRLKSWHPILTAKSAFPIFFVVGIILIPLGIVFLVTSNRVQEVVVEYTHCEDPNRAPSRCSELVRMPDFYSTYNVCSCSLEFTLQEDMIGQVYFYYGLSNFFQNHLRYVMSRDDNQLHGQIGELNKNCDPYRYDSSGKAYAPCGAIAMSLFNDTFKLKYHGAPSQPLTTPSEVPMTSKGIAWRTDVEKKFGKPPADSWAKTVKPASWPLTALQRSPDAYSGDEELLVWMRTSALPTFRKLYRIIEHSVNTVFKDGLPAGKYTVDIGYAYPVTQFGGTKRFIISTMSWLGCRNPTLGIAYLVMGIVSILIATVFLIIHLRIPKKIN